LSQTPLSATFIGIPLAKESGVVVKSPEDSGQCQMKEANLIVVVRTLARTDLKWNWYTLDRALARQPAHEWFNVVQAVEALAQRGLVVVVSSSNPSMPVYQLTELGSQWLEDHA
jgi:thiazole synthase ThiGH ThiG subunit